MHWGIPELDDDQVASRSHEPASAPEERIDASRTLRRVARELQGWAPADRGLLLSVAVRGAGYAESARAHDLSASAAKTRIHRSRRRLREAVEQ